jgi:hypothetical protein
MAEAGDPGASECPAAREPARPKARPRRTALLLAGGALAVPLALIAHYLLAQRHRPGTEWPDANQGFFRPDQPAAEPTTLPAGGLVELARNPLAGQGMEPLRDDPRDAIAPPGGVRVSGFRRQVPGGAADIIIYESSDRLESLETFYRTRLAEAGFKVLPSGSPAPQDARSLVFSRQGQSYQVLLRPTGGGRAARVVLVISRRGP